MPGALYRYLDPRLEIWSVRVNGRPVNPELEKGFATIARRWTPGDRVELDLPMPVRLNTCSDKVEANVGRVAVTRGPLVY